ncbi:MAG: hypothetical protein WA733_10385 [Methylocystis sp.]
MNITNPDSGVKSPPAPFKSLPVQAITRGFSATYFRKHCKAGTGPKHYVIGKNIFITDPDMDVWIEQFKSQ